jgi:hypothetical protein
MHFAEFKWLDHSNRRASKKEFVADLPGVEGDSTRVCVNRDTIRSRSGQQLKMQSWPIEKAARAVACQKNGGRPRAPLCKRCGRNPERSSENGCAQIGAHALDGCVMEGGEHPTPTPNWLTVRAIPCCSGGGATASIQI